MNNKGQAIFSEYVMIIFVVIATAVAMTTFVRRSLEARIHDARNRLIDTASRACDDNCKMAAGLDSSIPYEYEPYYDQHITMAQKKDKDSSGATASQVNWSIGAKYLMSFNEGTNSGTSGVQLPPICSAPDAPSCCSDGSSCVCKCLAGHVCGPDTCGNANGCGTCPDPAHFGCNNTTGKCIIACVCPTYTALILSNCGGHLCVVPYTYTAVCGPDTCGNVNGCNNLSGNSCSAPGAYCSEWANQWGVCWTPSAGLQPCCYAAPDGSACTSGSCVFYPSSNYNPP